jgi:hypothetical protein
MRRVLALALALFGCGPDTDGRLSGSTGQGGQHDGGDGGGDDLGINLDDLSGYSGPDACSGVTANANLTQRPVDIIFVIDTSGSMMDEIAATEKNINTNFAKIIGQSGLDYRVIMLAQFGPGGAPAFDVCIKPPLGGNPCTTESAPINTATYYQYDPHIDSNDSLRLILSTYNQADPHGSAFLGWSQWLRPNAAKVFIEITDDNATGELAADFDAALMALTPSNFGDATHRNYIWHSIVGIKENSPVIAPWQPADPIQYTACSTAVNAGAEYQQLSQLSGGLRFPVCQSASFDSVFNTVAQGVVAGSKIACNFDLPPAPAGQVVDLASVVVEYNADNSGVLQTFSQVSDAAHCAVNSFYVVTDVDAGLPQAILCPDTCATVQADSKAQIGVRFDCAIT